MPRCSTVVPAKTPEGPLKYFLTPQLSEVLSAALTSEEVPK
jgi:hypothetical protein